jgi:hypothetical protein
MLLKKRVNAKKSSEIYKATCNRSKNVPKPNDSQTVKGSQSIFRFCLATKKLIK